MIEAAPGPAAECRVDVTRRHHAESPEAATPAVVRRRLVGPLTGDVHAIARVAPHILRGEHEGERYPGQPIGDFGGMGIGIGIGIGRDNHESGIVVGAVAVLEPRCRAVGVLEQTPIVGHSIEVGERAKPGEVGNTIRSRRDPTVDNQRPHIATERAERMSDRPRSR